MDIDQFNALIRDQLHTLGGQVTHTIKPEARGYTVSLLVDCGQYDVSKFYTEMDVHLHSPQLIRTQITNLYRCLAQKVLDRNLGKEVMKIC